MLSFKDIKNMLLASMPTNRLLAGLSAQDYHADRDDHVYCSVDHACCLQAVIMGKWHTSHGQVSADVMDGSGLGYLLRSTSTSVRFPGYLAVYPPKRSKGLN